MSMKISDQIRTTQSTLLIRLVFLSVVLTVSSSSFQRVSVTVNKPATLPCLKSCSGEVKWMTATPPQVLVVQCHGETCTEGNGFKNRAKLVLENIRGGNLSLTLNPAVYNDKGGFVCSCDRDAICDVRLEVLVPTTVNASVGESVVLHCYAHTDRHVSDSAISVFWKKDNRQVLKVDNGVAADGPGFEGRVSVSNDNYRNGDLSLTISQVRQGDSGLYQCYNREGGIEEKGRPEAVTLNVEAQHVTRSVEAGKSLRIDLRVSDPVVVTFQRESSGSSSEAVSVCTVENGLARCSSDYSSRASVTNNVVILDKVSSSDSGVFMVKDSKTHGILSTFSITVVKDEPQDKLYFCFLLLLVLVPLGGALWWFCKGRQRKQNERQGLSSISGASEPQAASANERLTIPMTETNPPPDASLVRALEKDDDEHLSVPLTETGFRSPHPWKDE